jgi:hypothetical protein
MKTRKNMLRSSVAMLLVSVLALTTATYAWFTNGHGGKVEQITLTAATADGIELSADAIKWGGTIAYADLTGIDTNQMLGETGDTMDPLSSAGVVSAGALQLYTGTIDDNGFVATAVTDVKDVHCVKFDFYVRNTNASDAELYLDLTGQSSVSEDKTSTNPRTNTGVEKAVRVAFIDQGGQYHGTTISGTAQSDANSAKGLKEGNSSIVWEPNAGTSAATKVIGGAFTATSDKIVNGVIDSTVSSLTDLSTVKDGYVQIATVGANRISKVTVYIWLEGQDADCTNNATGGKFNVNLVFSNQGSTSTAGNQ